MLKTAANLVNLLKTSRISTICAGRRLYSEQSKSTTETPPEQSTESNGTELPSNCRFAYSDFLPSPDMKYRNALREKLERQDMLDRRASIDIPEFYVGSILAVTSSDPHSPEKSARFVGICIQRGGHGMRAYFVLRNAIDNQGIEIKYSHYDPTLRKVEVLLLEKRLDSELLYLRDAPLEYSRFDPDMEPKFHPEGEPVPINPLKVTLRPRPWIMRWERKQLKGVQLDSINEHITDKMRGQIKLRETPWEKYDLMKEYRRLIPEEEQTEIYQEVYPELKRQKQQRKVQKRSRTFVKEREDSSMKYVVRKT